MDQLGVKISSYEDIPFLPISFFKTHKVYTDKRLVEAVFTSSGTTSMTTSSHYIENIESYLNNCRLGFNQFYGDVEDYCFLALLPNYLERQGSSLIKMIEDFISQSKYKESGFYLYNHRELYDQLVYNMTYNIKTVLFGVSFALLDFIETHKLSFPELIIMETGGMKGRRKEILRTEMHDILMDGFGVPAIHSEYGMTELLSQGYSQGGGVFYPSKTMEVSLRSLDDPLETRIMEKTGVINIVDLANINSCAFLATDDIGRKYHDGGFEILGRLDISDMRGCNLLIT